MKKTLLLAVSVILLMSCTENTNTDRSKEKTLNGTAEQALSVQSAQTDVCDSVCCINDVVGVYTGTLPAASSPGIKTELTLNEDKTFMLISEFLEEKDGKFTEKGEFSIEKGILTTKAVGGGTISYFKIEPEQLRMLNQDKQEISGELADAYVLKKSK